MSSPDTRGPRPRLQEVERDLSLSPSPPVPAALDYDPSRQISERISPTGRNPDLNLPNRVPPRADQSASTAYPPEDSIVVTVSAPTEKDIFVAATTPQLVVTTRPAEDTKIPKTQIEAPLETSDNKSSVYSRARGTAAAPPSLPSTDAGGFLKGVDRGNRISSYRQPPATKPISPIEAARLRILAEAEKNSPVNQSPAEKPSSSTLSPSKATAKETTRKVSSPSTRARKERAKRPAPPHRERRQPEKTRRVEDYINKLLQEQEQRGSVKVPHVSNIATDLGVSESLVRGVAHKKGLPLPRRERPIPNPSPPKPPREPKEPNKTDYVTAALMRIKNNQARAKRRSRPYRIPPFTTLARELNVGVSTIYAVAKSLGLEPPGHQRTQSRTERPSKPQREPSKTEKITLRLLSIKKAMEAAKENGSLYTQPTFTQIAQDYGVDVSLVSTIAGELGIKPPKKRQPRRNNTKAAKVRGYFNRLQKAQDGTIIVTSPFKDIATELGVAPRVVTGVAGELGIKPSRKGKGRSSRSPRKPTKTAQVTAALEKIKEDQAEAAREGMAYTIPKFAHIARELGVSNGLVSKIAPKVGVKPPKNEPSTSQIPSKKRGVGATIRANFLALQASLERGEIDRIPSYRQLATEWGMEFPSVGRIGGALAREGLLQRNPPSSSNENTAKLRRTLGAIKRARDRGILIPIPSYDALQSRYHVSRRTAMRAVANLGLPKPDVPSQKKSIEQPQHKDPEEVLALLQSVQTAQALGQEPTIPSLRSLERRYGVDRRRIRTIADDIGLILSSPQEEKPNKSASIHNFICSLQEAQARGETVTVPTVNDVATQYGVSPKLVRKIATDTNFEFPVANAPQNQQILELLTQRREALDRGENDPGPSNAEIARRVGLQEPSRVAYYAKKMGIKNS